MSRQPEQPARGDQRWDHIFRDVLQEILTEGETVTSAPAGKSVGSGRVTKDLRNYQFTLIDPRDRILTNPVRRLNLFVAVARFIWMISGNDRVKDIAFYEPRVAQFTDDQMTVPGSNYGKRLLMPEPGLDQVRAVIERLKEDKGTRRAVGSIYQAEDAVRQSKDIPCAFGVGFHVRDDRLHMTTIMRSNAAWSLLPFNIFEFTLLGELVSVLAGLQLGSYTHFALSLHLYEGAGGNQDEIAQASKAMECTVDSLIPPMEPMPPTTWEELARIIKWETDLRYGASGLNVTNFRSMADRCEAEFHPYWSSLCLTLLTYVLMNNGHPQLARAVLERIPEPLRRMLDGHPHLAKPERPGLENDPVLLSSRTSLLEYATRDRIDDAAREELWGAYDADFARTNETAVAGERRRQESLRIADWERRHSDLRNRKKQPELFEQ